MNETPLLEALHRLAAAMERQAAALEQQLIQSADQNAILDRTAAAQEKVADATITPVDKLP